MNRAGVVKMLLITGGMIGFLLGCQPAPFPAAGPTTGSVAPALTATPAPGNDTSGPAADIFIRHPGPDDGKARATATALAVRPVEIPLEEAPIKGDPRASVTILVYSDYQCPFCWQHWQEIRPQLQPYIDAGQVRIAFKDFPNHTLHPQAQKAHESARCARELGGDEAFWAMHDLLFASQSQWAGNPNAGDVFKALAAEGGLLPEPFGECLDSGRYEEVLNADFAEA
ncbi:MAG: DsbA family protein, partial [Chloroflexi bacterium]|nr:DsbA family protein [Chloroflexota bacterium]